MKNFFVKLYKSAVELNHRNIVNMLGKNLKAVFLDLGCDDGELSMLLARKIGTKKVYGVEILDNSIRQAREKGIKVTKLDLNKKLNFDDNYFDVIHCNQTIEHLNDSDRFLAEMYRVLKPNGYAIVSTENASSWCNIFASIMGWQIFSLTNFSSKKGGIGNPFAIHKKDALGISSWNHIRIYNIRGLKEYFEAFDFYVEKISGAGYFPLPAIIGNIDKTHCHLMTFKIRKVTK